MKVLVECEDGERKVRVIETKKDGSRLYYDGGALYTQIDANGNNLLEYVAAMNGALATASNVLLLGTAGGALATQLSRRGVSVTAVDNWAQSFEIARRWFQLPASVECVHADALDFLRTTGRQWDAVAVDVFHGVEIPESILVSDIGSLLAKVVSSDGLIVWNVADEPRSWAARWIAKALRIESLDPYMVSVLEWDVGNTLVICRNTPSPDAVSALHRKRRLAELDLFTVVACPP